MLNGLDLFSGIGGLTLALSPWVRTIAYCENDRYAQAVLLSRMSTGELPSAPIWDDVQTLRGDRGRVELISAGFPCQDISVAGTGYGLGGIRSGLFYELLRLVGECGPQFVFLENVPAITVRGLDRVLLGLHALGYDARWTIVSAGEMGAVHIRERWFLLAHSNRMRLREERGKKERQDHTKRQRSLVTNGACQEGGSYRSSKGHFKPRVDRAGDGIPYRMDRHRGLGNSVYPEAAREAFKRLIGIA